MRRTLILLALCTSQQALGQMPCSGSPSAAHRAGEPETVVTITSQSSVQVTFAISYEKTTSDFYSVFYFRPGRQLDFETLTPNRTITENVTEEWECQANTWTLVSTIGNGTDKLESPGFLRTRDYSIPASTSESIVTTYDSLTLTPNHPPAVDSASLTGTITRVTGPAPSYFGNLTYTDSKAQLNANQLWEVTTSTVNEIQEGNPQILITQPGTFDYQVAVDKVTTIQEMQNGIPGRLVSQVSIRDDFTIRDHHSNPPVYYNLATTTSNYATYVGDPSKNFLSSELVNREELSNGVIKVWDSNRSFFETFYTDASGNKVFLGANMKLSDTFSHTDDGVQVFDRLTTWESIDEAHLGQPKRLKITTDGVIGLDVFWYDNPLLGWWPSAPGWQFFADSFQATEGLLMGPAEDFQYHKP